MKLAKKFANLAALAFALSLGSTVGAQSQPAQKPAPKAKAAKSSKAAKSATAKPAAAQSAPGSAPAAAPESAPANPTGAEKADVIVAKRDPFVPLVAETKEGGPTHLPPGKAGLVISSVHVDGTVKAPNGMLAVLSNPDQRVYFVREGDHLYDGDVEKIGLDGVTFKENSKDAFGKEVERLITKRIYPSAGEQQ